MANRRRLTFAAAFALSAFATFGITAAPAHLPWAATSGTHFVEAVVNADNYRMRAAALAIKRSPSADVRDFARELWADSLEDTRRLNWTLTKDNPLFVLWDGITPEYMFVLDELVAADSDGFDERFIAQQAASLNEALTLAEGYVRAGDDLHLKEFAARSVPQLKMQLDRITVIRAQHRTLAMR